MYLGNQPALNYISFASQTFSIVNSQTSYTLDHSVVNGLDILLYINNVKQVEGSGKAYTASGNTLTIASPLTSGSDEMYCIYIGKAVQSVVPPSGSVTNAMLGETITVAKGGTGLTSGFANGITMIDQFALTSDKAGSGDVTANLSRTNTTGFGRIGTGMTESSGIFSFPSTGIYLVIAKAVFATDSNGDRTQELFTKVTTNNSTYTSVDDIQCGDLNGSLATTATGTGFVLVDVTDTSNVKVKFETGSIDTGSTLEGKVGDYNKTTFTFVRLGDT